MLKGGQEKKAEGLPAGITYTVAETDYTADGYTTAKDGDTGEITEDDTATASFTNTKNTYGQLVVTKNVAGNAADTDKEFSFSVELKTGDVPLANTTLGDNITTDNEGKIIFALKDGQSKTITNIPNGTSYTVSEADYTSDGYVVTTKTGDTGIIVGDAADPSTAAFVNTKNVEVKTPLLTITKTSDTKEAKVGDVVLYTITVTNSGKGDAVGVEIVDTLPEGLTYVSDDSNGAVDEPNVTWTVDVAAGESMRIIINAQINEAAVGKVVNTVQITTSDVPTTPDGEKDDFEFPITPNSGGSEDPKPDEPDKTSVPPKGETPTKTASGKTTSAQVSPKTDNTTNPAL